MTVSGSGAIGRTSEASLGAARGSVSVEALVALPVVFGLSLTVWQLLELLEVDLQVRHAAFEAARAAALVLPDDPQFHGISRHSYAGERREAIERAARRWVRRSRRLPAPPRVELAPQALDDDSQQISATVSVDYHCIGGWASALCGANGITTVSHTAKQSYHGAIYRYTAPPTGRERNRGPADVQ